jgi:hypothetical protein
MEGIGSQQAICYVTNSDGTLAVLTKVKKESIGGWLLWTTAGTFQRIGIVDRQGWTLTRRNIAGTWRNFIEVFDDDWRLDAAISAVFGSPTSHVGPFPLYVGQSVTAITGDLYIGEFVVDSTGYIDLPLEVSQVEIGLNFVPRVVPLQMEVPLADGISYGKPKRYVRTIADILDTASIRVAGRTLNTSQPDTDPGAPTPTRTGQFEVWHLGWHVQPDIEITSPLPLPFTMRGLMIEVEV